MVNVLSLDGKQDPDLMAANASSAALMLSDIPWNGPIGVIRVGRIDGNFVLNPTVDEVNLLWFRLPFCSILNCACIVPMILDIYTARGPYISLQHFIQDCCSRRNHCSELSFVFTVLLLDGYRGFYFKFAEHSAVTVHLLTYRNCLRGAI